MRIAHRLFDIAADRAGDLKVEDVRIGLGYTAVMLENHQAGLAYTFREEFPEGCSVFHGSRPLSGKRAKALLSFLKSGQSIELALGLATANALMNHEKQGCHTGDVIRYIDIRPTDQVGMVGLFAPLIKPIEAHARELKIFEKDPRRRPEGVFPMEAMDDVLPHCHVAIITSTTILNGTVDRVLAFTKNCREVVMLGASTPLVPEAFEDTPVSCLSGGIVRNPQEVLRTVSEGGGMRNFGEAITKVNLRIRNTSGSES